MPNLVNAGLVNGGLVRREMRGPIRVASSGVTLMALNDFEFGADGDLVTAAALDSAEQGTAWTWTLSRTPIGHTRIRTTGNDNFTLAATVNGAAIPTGGTRRVRFDLDEAALDNLTPIYDQIFATPSVSATRLVVAGFVRPGATAASNYIGMDLIQIAASPYLTMQLNLHGAGHEGTGGELHIETQSDGGVTYKSTSIPITLGTVYAYELLWDGVTGDMALLLLSADQSTIIGTSGKRSTDAISSPFTFAALQSYINPEAGYIEFDKFSRVWGPSTAFPLFPLTVPAPASITLVQEISGQLVLGWDSPALAFTIERSSNAGGSWTALETDAESLDFPTATSQRYRYEDDTVSDATAYRYRVTALIGSAASSATSTSDVTVDNAHSPVATDGFNDMVFGNEVKDRVGWGGVGSWVSWIGGGIIYGSADGFVYYDGVVAAANHRSEVNLNTVAYLCGPAVNCQTGNDYGYGCGFDFSGHPFVAVVSGGGTTTLATDTSVTLGYSDSSKLAIYTTGTGSGRRVFVEIDTGSGWTPLTALSNVNPGVYLDGGQFGLWCGSANGTILDNWKGYNL